MWIFLSALLLPAMQMQEVLATGCGIVSVISPSASSLNVEWSDATGATVYLLDFRVANSTSVAPVVVMTYPPSTHRLVQGLRPGHTYVVTLKVLLDYVVVCKATYTTMTVPATSQITYSRAISSTSIIFEWSSVFGADSYSLYVEELFSIPANKYNKAFTTLSGRVDGLAPSTTYNCYVHASNKAGSGTRSNIRTLTTLVQPPPGVTLVLTGKSTARVTWASVNKVLLYQVTVSDNDNTGNAPIIKNTSSTTMDITNLEPCSTYTVGVSSVNVFLVPGEASNATLTTSTINPVTSITVVYSCSSGMVTVTWDLVFGANLYRAMAVDGMGASLNCTSESNNCQITMLKCGEKYSVYVTAISDDCESMGNTSTLFETVPCAPAHTMTSHDCSSNVILFSWETTNNTLYYVATAEDINGQVTECRTQDSTCFFTNTGCGQFYTYTVYAVSSECNSDMSQLEFVRTSPCLPTNIKTAAECHSETLITTWDSAAGALSYTVEAQGNTGETYNCTSSSNSCAVTGVPCGEQLSVWIVASNDNCSTNRVLGEVAQTVPCSPTILSASAECSQDSANITWTTSIGAIFYTAIVRDMNGNSHDCTSAGTECLVEGLTCGQNYSAHIIGSNFKCNSSAGTEIAFNTAPCPPDNIEAFRDCDANHALIVWQNHQATGNYTATIEDQSGSQLTCNSDTVNNCKIPNLPCGKRYNVSVTNNDGNCLSTSTSINMDSVPCGPEDVEASMSCLTGQLTMTWSISVPADNYTATISRGLGQPLYCNSSETRCTSGGLACGSTYSVTVVAVTGSCYSMPSTDVIVQTMPCPPTVVTAVKTCPPDPVLVQWVASDSASSYAAVAVSSKGYSSVCTTNQTVCNFSDLMCGEVYNITVAGVDNNCTGLYGDAVSLYTEPCVPTNVASQLDCAAGTFHVFWNSDPNAVSYTVIATNMEEMLTCISPTSNCTLRNLLCDHPYDIFVTATDGTCVSSGSVPIWQAPVPCAPADVNTTVSCSTNHVMVRWRNSSWPLNYSATATPLSGNMTSATCHTGGAYCSLTGLHCGQTYNVSVKGCYGDCPGPYSTPQTIMTVPCVPQSLEAITECGTNSIWASWSASLGATSYTATMTGPNGFLETCLTSNLTCSFSNLQCGTQYSINVMAHDDYCDSASAQKTMTTGPCDPVNVTTILQCGSNVATVSWHASTGATGYHVLAYGLGLQLETSCWSMSTSCRLDGLQCGTTYNLIVLAEDNWCNSTGDSQTTLMTVPCSPYIKNSTQICGANSSYVSWMPVADATGYIINASSTMGHSVSCSSATSVCELRDLACGEIYTATVVAQGSLCDSPPGPSANITTAPCPPVVLSKQYMCGNNTALLSWSDTVGRVIFQAEIAGDGYQDSCRTTNTTCVVHNLPCGLNLNFTVQAEGEYCTSSPSVCHTLQTAPCAPVNVSATLVCLNHSVLVSWVGSPSAVEYTVTSTDQNGNTHQCHSNSSTCQLSHMQCGQTYDMTVTAHSDSCAGSPSQVYSFTAGLCAPTNVTVSPACDGNNTVSWSSVAGAHMYIATAAAQNDKHTHNCSAKVSTSCRFTDLHCGQNYSVSVVTVDRGCQSQPSSAVQVMTAMCPPANLVGEVTCDTNAVTVSWDPSPVPGVSYVLKYEQLSSSLPPLSLTTSNTSHTLTNLQCGQQYAFYVAFLDGACHSSYSPPMELSTAPCQPSNFNAQVDCGMNKGNFSWAQSDGAAFYTVQVTGEHGHMASCTSNLNSCTISLHCGRSYSASLLASTQSCNSTQHANIYFDSAPCLPDDVVAIMDCYTNVMNVSWSETPGSDNYTAWAISLEGHRASCNSTYNNCFIHDLHCGHVYEVAVTSSSIQCEIIAGSDYKIQAAPCKPENVTGDLNCSSNVLTVTWDQVSLLVQNFTVEATSLSGVNSTCESSGRHCSFLDLSCGQLYTFTVMGHTNVCMSQMSYSTQMLTAPCPPGEVSVAINCSTRKAEVSWDTTAAASAYSVYATSGDGYNSSCSEMGTSCELGNLVCGQDYWVLVESIHIDCAGPSTVPVLLTTDPCVPMNISIRYSINESLVQWSTADGASSYTARAANDQGWTVTCNSTGSSCHLSGLRCGHIYNVSVTAHNQACDSATSETQRLMTEPCPPSNVQANVECGQLSATISWEQSMLALGYVAYLYDHSASYTLMCEAEATNSSCSAWGLTCGTRYHAWVVALGDKNNSSDSTMVMFKSEPCQPSSIEAIMDCEIKSAIVSWLPGAGSVSYMAELTSSLGHMAMCASNQTYCLVAPLQCGEEYSVTVTSVGYTCNSTQQMSGYLTTEACVPMNVSIHFNMSQAGVTWGTTQGAGSYWVKAVTEQGLSASCNSTGNWCTVTGLQCGQVYNISVAAKNDVCNSTATSEIYPLMTEPCPPNNVQTNVQCEQLSVELSWEQSELALGYVAYLYDHYGYDTLMCVAEGAGTTCAVSGFMCGTQYDAWVVALGLEYNSSDSAVVSFTSAPCLPTNINVEVDCYADGAAVASWSPPYGAANISLTASASVQANCQAEQKQALSICNLTALVCGESYNLSLTASNDHCSVTSHMRANFTTRPCQPRNVSVDLPCGSESAVMSWELRPQVELYMASAVSSSGGHEHWCNTTNFSCVFQALSCGQMYSFTVKALSHGCCSQVSDAIYIQTEPCQPVIELAQSPCQSEELQLSWNLASGARFYLIMATGNLGYVDNFNTTQTSLTVALPCGQSYSVVVQGQGSECYSDPSSPAFVKTSPCIPRDVMTLEQCGANTASVSWRASDGAQSYAAEAIGPDGRSHWCYSNSTNCTWDDLSCGEQYTVLVMAQDANCASMPSNSSLIYTEPCLPQNVLVSVDCDASAVWLSWDAANGTTTYVLSLETRGQSVMQSTNETQVRLAELRCGVNYSLSVTPHNQYCAGVTGGTTFIQTWPCPPEAVYAMRDCLSGGVAVTWRSGNGTDHYTANVDSDGAGSQMCMSSSDRCDVSGLTCGQSFSVSVTASNKQCNTTAVANHSVQSVPCIPTDVSVAKNCYSNSATVSWSASDGATQYLVTAFCYHTNVSHLTSDLNCTLDELACGSRYSLQVVAMDDHCSSVPSQVLVFDSAPCPPENISTQLDCISNNLTVSWDSVGDADYFLVRVSEDNAQGGWNLNTTAKESSTSNLNCGSVYAVQVTAVRGDCQSRSAQNYSISAAPCQPQIIQGSLDCVTNSAQIWWDPAPGAERYVVSAVGQDRSSANCSAWTNSSCEVEDLACGLLYYFSVTAMNGQCVSLPSAAIDLQTAPCSLSGITAIPECHGGAILVTWKLAEGGEGNAVYTATAEAADRTFLSCNSTGTNCTLLGARCDLRYTVIVSASSDHCSALRSPPYRISMEPCPPGEVNVSASCEDSSALVSWSTSPVAAAYRVVAATADGHVRICDASAANCSLSGLRCDEQYAAHVTASHENCTSVASHNVTFSTGPCEPEGLRVTFHCSNLSAELRWSPSDNVVDYHGCAQAETGEILCCHSSVATCTIDSLDCGTLYNFTVQASDGACNSSFSQLLQKGAAPCPPDTVEVQAMMTDTEIQTLRFSWTEISCPDTEYLLRLSGNLLGDSQAQFEMYSYWTSTTWFELPLPCSSHYVATVESRNAAGSSNGSTPLHGTTVPCEPSEVVYSSNMSVAQVSWSPSPFASMYSVYERDVSPSALLCTTGGLSCFLLLNVSSSDLLVTATNGAGESPGAAVTTTVHQVRKRDLTESGGLSVPVLNVTLLSNMAVLAEWPQEDAEDDAAYKLAVTRQRGDGESDLDYTVLGQSYILTDLSSNSTYCLTVSAVNEAQVGPWSDPVCLETGPDN